MTDTNLASADLEGIRSGGITGVPFALPASWSLISGFLIGPWADLSGADLAGLDLSGLDFSGAYMAGAILTGAQLADIDYDSNTIGLVEAMASAMSNEHTLDEIADLRPGSSMIEIIDGSATLNFKVQESTNLIDWFDTAESSTVIVPAPDAGKKFFRFSDEN